MFGLNTVYFLLFRTMCGTEHLIPEHIHGNQMLV